MTLEDGLGAVSDPLWHRLYREASADGSSSSFWYQHVLRCVGQFLDAHGACRINILEVTDGFTVRYQSDLDSFDSHTGHLTRMALEQTARDLETRRRRLSFNFGRGAGKANYEDILRALGYELDFVRAYSLLIDEVDEGLVVTYQFLKPSEGFNVRKRMVILGQEAMRKVVDDAHSRRERRDKGVLNLLAG